MIRPVLYVDLPGIVFALDQRARMRGGEVANFILAPQCEEPRSSVAALWSALWPIAPNVHTWICEDRWHLLGVAQAQPRPGSQAWDLTYLGAMTAPGGQPPTIPQDDVFLELVQYALNAAMMKGVHRFFVRMNDDLGELELFGKMGFQRYARELTYWLPADDGSTGGGTGSTESTEHFEDTESGESSATEAVALPLHRYTRIRTTLSLLDGADGLQPEVPLRPWHRHDAWGLLRLYDASTPRRVQMAESLTSDELLHTRAGGGRTWYLPLVEPGSVAFVHDLGVRLGGWLRLRYGRGTQPHQLSVMANPDEPAVAPALIRFGLRVLRAHSQRLVICRVREYEGHVINALRDAGFEHGGTEALLVRHLTMRALRHREVPALESRVVYGVRGLGTAQTRLSKGEKTSYATHDH